MPSVQVPVVYIDDMLGTILLLLLLPILGEPGGNSCSSVQ